MEEITSGSVCFGSNVASSISRSVGENEKYVFSRMCVCGRVIVYIFAFIGSQEAGAFVTEIESSFGDSGGGESNIFRWR